MWQIALVFAGFFLMRGFLVKRFGHLLPSPSPTQLTFAGHTIILASGVTYIIPLELFGFGTAKLIAYKISVSFAAAVSGLTVTANYGVPDFVTAVKTRSLQPIVPWCEKALQSADFQFVFFALIFMTSQPSIMALLILLRRSFWFVCTMCQKLPPTSTVGSKIWLRIAPHWADLKRQEAEAQKLSAVTEVLLAFFLTACLIFPPRQLLVVLLYWNFLRMRFQGSRSHAVQLQAWTTIGSRFEPILQAVPILNKPIDLAKGFFRPQ